MKTIRVRKEETGNELVIFSRYFGYPSKPDANGMIILRDNSNYYTPIYVQECKKDEADYRLITSVLINMLMVLNN